MYYLITVLLSYDISILKHFIWFIDMLDIETFRRIFGAPLKFCARGEGPHGPLHGTALIVNIVRDML